MKKLRLFIITCTFISCNSDKNISESQPIHTDFIGLYEYQTSEPSEHHYIVIDTLDKSYYGLYYGTEAINDHGVFFYGNSIENLNIQDQSISFDIGRRNLYTTTRFKIVKHRRDLDKDSAIGVSKDILKYNGTISNTSFKL